MDSQLAQSPWSGLDISQWRERVAEHGAVNGVKAALASLEQWNMKLNAASFVLAEEALSRAEELDSMPIAERGALHGVPFVVKDEIDVAGYPSTFGTCANTSIKQANSDIVNRLLSAGAIVLAKTRMPEFGAWPQTYTDHAGATRNPYYLDRTPGGSSGGTAALVAAGVVPFGLGGDGGGSIRIPSSYCGLVGYKPQGHDVDAAPYPSVWLNLGTLGALTRTVNDSLLVNDIISDHDLRVEDVSGPLRIGWTTSAPVASIRTAPENEEAVHKVIAKLRAQGHIVVPLKDNLPNPVLAFSLCFLAAIKSETKEIEDTKKLDSLSKQLVFVAKFMPKWLQNLGLKQADKLKEKTDKLFADVDLLLMPTTAIRPPQADDLHGKNVLGAVSSSVPATAFTAMWNVTGNPAIALPAGKDAEGLPLSVQLVGPYGGQRTVFAGALAVEEGTKWE